MGVQTQLLVAYFISNNCANNHYNQTNETIIARVTAKNARITFLIVLYVCASTHPSVVAICQFA